jgi:8-oxo-dGTP pyrophosphatase MutT (NUDIX family)
VTHGATPSDPHDGTALHDDAVRLLTGWTAPDAAQDDLRHRYLSHLAAHPDGVWKAGPPEHLTASCLVLDPSGTRTLLVHHAKGGFWVQPGGHCEPDDPTLVAAAAREAREELGVPDLEVHPVPAQLDRHELSSAFGRCRAHLDVRFLAVAPADAVPVRSAESRAVGWAEVDELPPTAVPDLVRALGYARVALARL